MFYSIQQEGRVVGVAHEQGGMIDAMLVGYQSIDGFSDSVRSLVESWFPGAEWREVVS